VGQQKNTITLNGNVYNAKTGTVIDGVIKPPKRRPISDFGRGTNVPFHKPVQPKPAPHQHKIAGTARDKHHAPEHTQTLMRSVVEKPHRTKVSKPAVKLPDPVKTLPTEQIDDKKIERAKSVPRSHLISRFNPISQPKFVKKTAPLHVRAHPSSNISHHESSPINDIVFAPVTPVDDLLSNALDNAKSHEQAPPKRIGHIHKLTKKISTKSKFINVTAVLLSSLVLIGFIVYQNVPNISIRLASAKTGVHASLPDYKPGGFTLGRSVQTSPGQVVISFRSNSDDRNFTIAQSTSNWNSDTLRDNFVASSGQQYQRITTTNGKTIYVYGDSNATWVDGGVWYKIEGNSALSSSQLLKIASSF